MERKDYEEKFIAVKNEILKEIRKLIPCGNARKFKEPFCIHYVNGEVATNELCQAVEVWSDGMVVFIVLNETHSEETIKGEGVLQYDPESFLDILDHLQKEVREKELSHLREIVKRNGGRIKFDETTYGIRLSFNGKTQFISVETLYIDEYDRFCIGTTRNECFYAYECKNLLVDDLDDFITYVESYTKQKFVIRVSGSYSRTFDIEASTYEEALAEAKKDWEINPLRYDDSNGEDWEDYTSRAH